MRVNQNQLALCAPGETEWVEEVVTGSPVPTAALKTLLRFVSFAVTAGWKSHGCH